MDTLRPPSARALDARAQRVARFVLGLFVAAMLLFALVSCATIKVAGGAAGGAGIGFAAGGPVGAIVGAGLGGAGGHMLAENDRLTDELTALQAKNEKDHEIDRARIADLERRVDKIPDAPPPRAPRPPPDKPATPWWRRSIGQDLLDMIWGVL